MREKKTVGASGENPKSIVNLTMTRYLRMEMLKNLILMIPKILLMMCLMTVSNENRYE